MEKERRASKKGGASRLRRADAEHENQAILRNERLLAETQRIAHLGNWEWDPQQDTDYWSDELFRIYGLDPETDAASQETFFSCVHPEDRPFVQEKTLQLLAEHKPISFEFRIVRPDGTVRTVWSKADVLTDETGRSVRLLGIVQDITERRRAEEALHYRDAILRAAGFAADRFLKTPTWQESIQDVLAALGRATGVSRVYLFENQTDPAGLLLASQRAEWTAPGIEPQIDNPELQGVPYDAGFARWKEILCRDEPVYGQVEMFPPDEAAFLIAQGITSIVVMPVFVADRWWGFMGFDACIIQRAWTASEVEALRVAVNTLGAAIWRRQFEQQLLDEERKLIRAQRIAHLGYWEWDVETDTLHCSDELCQIYGLQGATYSIDTLVGMLHPQDQAFVKHIIVQTLRTRQPSVFHYRIVRADGAERILHGEMEVVGEEEGRVGKLFGIAHDVTEARKAEEALREREFHYRFLAENITDMISRHTPYGICLYASQACRGLLGFEADELVGRNIYALVHPRDRADVQKMHRDCLDGDGIGVVCFRSRKRDDGYRWMESACRSVRNPETNEVQEIICVTRDITTRKEFEDRLVEAKERAEEMSRLKSSLLTNLSHEIRTPLTGIITAAELLADEGLENGDEFVDMIRKSGQRLLETLNSLLDLAQLEGGQFKLRLACVDLVEEVRAVVQCFRLQAEQRELYLRLEIPTAKKVAIQTDQGLLGRVLCNLISNAIKFTHEGGVTVTVEAGEDGAILRVADTGIGIGEAFLAHVFDEFKQESTGWSRNYEGNGLGLAITKRMVAQLGGAIEVASKKGQGTIFTVNLPRTLAGPAFEAADEHTLAERRYLQPYPTNLPQTDSTSP